MGCIATDCWNQACGKGGRATIIEVQEGDQQEEQSGATVATNLPNRRSIGSVSCLRFNHDWDDFFLDLSGDAEDQGHAMRISRDMDLYAMDAIDEDSMDGF